MCGCGDLKYAPKQHNHSQYVTTKELNQVLGSYLTGEEILDYLAANYYTKSEVDDLLAALQSQIDDLVSQVEPIGTIKIWPKNGTWPTGWMECNNASLSRTTYADLFALIGTTFGSSSGTTFNLPDLRGMVPVGRTPFGGMFNNVGETGGSQTVTLTESQMPSHNHQYTSRAGSGADAITYTNVLGLSNRFAVGGGGGTEQVQNPFIQNTGGGAAHSNVQPYLTLTFIIKAE